MTTLSREPAATETRFFVLTRNLSIYDADLPQLRRLSGMISTVKATMHKVVGAMADDLLPPRDPCQCGVCGDGLGLIENEC